MGDASSKLSRRHVSGKTLLQWRREDVEIQQKTYCKKSSYLLLELSRSHIVFHSDSLPGQSISAQLIQAVSALSLGVLGTNITRQVVLMPDPVYPTFSSSPMPPVFLNGTIQGRTQNVKGLSGGAQGQTKQPTYATWCQYN